MKKILVVLETVGGMAGAAFAMFLFALVTWHAQEFLVGLGIRAVGWWKRRKP